MLGSSGVVGFTRVCAGGRWIHSGSLCSLGFALGVVGFTLVRPRSRWIFARCVFGFICGRWTRGRLVLSRFSWVQVQSLDSLGIALVVVGFIRGHWVH